MSNTTFTISTTEELIGKIKEKNPNISNFFNEAALYRLSEQKTQKRVEFMWFIALPFLAFLGLLYLTLYLKDMFFYILMAILAIYLIIFIYLFVDKHYRSKKV